MKERNLAALGEALRINGSLCDGNPFNVFGSIVVATFSRSREFRADKGGSYLAGPENMIAALKTLKSYAEVKDPQVDQPAYQAFKISSSDGWMKLFASHPPLDERINAIKKDFRV